MRRGTPDVVLIGNYAPDRQESMIRFAESLERDLRRAGLTVETWRPPARLAARMSTVDGGAGKWLGYLDKHLVFPVLLVTRRLVRRRRLRGAVFHVCDHSNAPYLRWLPRERTVITTHDVLAIRGALGHADAYCPASRTGRILQRWILRHLVGARWLTADSTATLDQLEELATTGSQAYRRVVHLALNDDFGPVPAVERAALLRDSGVDPDTPFLLHVGSGLPRKNRQVLVDLAVDTRHPWPGQVVFAGAPLEPALVARAERAGLAHRTVSVVGPDHAHLRALYAACTALVFPSLSEGFGWPVIEAQACGAPVVSSELMPMPEVGGPSVLYADPHSPAAFARAVARLAEPGVAESARRGGLENCLRFASDRVVPEFLSMYEAVRRRSMVRRGTE